MNTTTAPPGLEDAAAAVQRTGAIVIGYSHHAERPNCSQPGDWWINVDFTEDKNGWEAMDKLTQAIMTPPPEVEDLTDLITFEVWTDAGLRFTISGISGADPYALANAVHRTLALWEDGW